MSEQEEYLRFKSKSLAVKSGEIPGKLLSEEDGEEVSDYFLLLEWIPSRFKGDKKLKKILAYIGAGLLSLGIGTGVALGQDAKITALPANAAPAGEDLVACVNDPAGTPATQKCTLTAIFGAFGPVALAGVTTMTDGQFCQGNASSGFDCDVAGALADDDLSDDLPTALSNVTTITNTQFCVGNAGGGFDCTTAGALADDDVSDDLITALSGVTTVTDGSYCQGGSGSSMDCDVAFNAGTDPTADLEEEGQINATAVTGNAIDDQLIIGSGANTAAYGTIPDCNTDNMLTYTQSTNTFGCDADDGAGGGMTSFDVQGDDGAPNVTITNGNVLIVSGGTNITTEDGDAGLDTLSVALDLTGITDTQMLFDSSDALGGASQVTHDGTNLTVDLVSGDSVESTLQIEEVYNNSGGTIFKCSAVYISGFNVGADLPEVSVADNDGAGTMPALGLIQADITTGNPGFVVTSGSFGGLDTSVAEVWVEGNPVYVNNSGTSGSADCQATLTEVKPTTTGELIQAIGRVVRVNAANGEIVIQGAGRSNDVPVDITIGAADTINTDTVTLDNTWASGQLASTVVLDSESPAAGDVSGDFATGLTVSGLANDDLSDDLPTALSNVTTINNTQFCVGNAGGGFDCTTAGTLADDNVGDDLITALSGVTTVTDGQFCQGGAGSSMDCDVAGALADDDLSDDNPTALSGVTTMTDGSYCQGNASTAFDCDVTQANIPGTNHIDADTEISVASLETHTKTVSILSATTGEDGLVRFVLDGDSSTTITKFWCETDANTCTVNLEERAEATPNTVGTDVATADVVCDTNSQTASLTNTGIDLNDPLAVMISACGAVGVVNIHVRYTVDD